MSASRALGVAFVVASAALLASLGRVWAVRVDDEEHERFAAGLARARELDARMDEEVARTRLGLVQHYDGMVRAWDLARTTSESLRSPPRYLGAPERAELAARLARYREELEHEHVLLEGFKAHHAVLRNSLRALPHNARRLVARLRARPDGAVAARALEAAVLDVVLATQEPSEAHHRQATARVEALASLALGDDPELAPALALVRRHAEVVLARHVAVEAAVRAALSLRVSAIVAEVGVAYERAHDEATTRERAWVLSAMACFAVTLVLAAALAITRLRAERDREAELAALKSRFVSMTSHEFRTPLSVILSSAELLETYGEGWDSEKRAKHVERIQEGGHAMARMLDQVLLIGRAEANMIELRPGPVHLGALTEAVIEEVRAMVGAERRLELELDACDEEVQMDEKLLRHVLGNLLSNAFKYSGDDSTVRLRVEARREAAIFEVTDEGIGIPPRDRARLFEAFHRCQNAEAIPGTGLGLAVVQKSVEVHGGSIEVDSELGRGTTFRVRLPYLGEAA